MGIWEILLIVACVALVVGVIVFSLIKKKNGKCGGGCSDCPYCKSCHSRKGKSNNQK